MVLRSLKFLAALVRGALWVVLGLAMALVLAWGALHWVIVPRIDEFRPRLQEMASHALGVPVRIGALEARSNGLVPSITVRDLVLPGAGGQPGLHVPSAVAAFSVASLLRGGLEQLVLDGPELEVRRTGAGRWQVAGFDLTGDPQADTQAADWVFSQPELVVRGGSVRWVDELRGGEPVTLGDVLIVVRNGLRHHQLRLDATPPTDLGDRFMLRGQFRRSLLERHAGAWKTWDGTLYADLPRLDVARLPVYLRPAQDLGLQEGAELRQGSAALRLWADVARGAPTRVLGDLAAGDVNALLGTGLEPLMLKSLATRVGWQRSGRSTAVWTQGLRFEPADGPAWPGGNVRLEWRTPGSAREPGGGQLHAEQLDLDALGRIARSLPLTRPARDALQRIGPARGLVEQVQAQWTGPADEPTDWRLQTRLRQLALAARPSERAPSQTPHGPVPHPGVPGIEGADVDLDATPAGGHATLAIRQGALEFPGVFEEPRIPLQSLSANAGWKVQGEHIEVALERLQLANADATGEFKIGWKTGTAPGKRFPGVLDLQGQFSRANGARVHRYLPLGIPPDARHYVRDAIAQGNARNVAVRIRGDLTEVPFDKHPAAGEFRFAGQVSDVVMHYVPRSIQPRDQPAWPALTELGGELIFERNSMRVRGAHARVQDHPGWELPKIEAGIADLGHTRVTVQAEGQGPLAAALGIVRDSPVALLTEHALDDATGSGAASLKLSLDLPVDDIHHAKVKGSVQLAGNDIQLSPGSPRLAAAQGGVEFSDTGFAIRDARTRVLGGEARVSGGSVSAERRAAGAAPVEVRVSGNASAEGLRGMADWGPVAALARQASGSANYEAVLGFRGAQPEIQVSSDLRGLGFDLPEPLAKPQAAAWPLRVELRQVDARDRVRASVSDVLSAEFELDASRPEGTRVLRGAVGVGAQGTRGLALPASGVLARADLPRIDVDAWEAAVTRVAGKGAGDDDALRAYLPDRLSLHTGELVMDGRTLHQVSATGTREGTSWRADVSARELAGRVTYREGTAGAAGAVVARLTRLVIPDSQNDEAAALLAEPPSRIPALDVVADSFELRGKPLGRLEVQAVNLDAAARPAPGNRGAGAEWRLNTLRLSAPDATFSAHGRWAAPEAAGAARRTTLDFELDIHDAGKLLERFGMEGVVRRGKGQFGGRIGWTGAPTTPHYPSMDGQLHLDIGAGQFLKADPGVAKLLGVLSLQSLPRRLTLDFRDVFSQGFAFDFVRGDVAVQHGVARTSNLQMKGASAAVLMDGSADLARETQDLRVLVVPEIDAGTAALVATAINPAIGISAFLAQLILQRPLAKAATREFRLTGSWDEPKVTPVAAGSAGALQPALPAESASAAPAARNPAPAPEPEAAGSGAAPAPPRTVEEPS